MATSNEIKNIKQKVTISSKTVLAEGIFRMSFGTDLCADAVPGQFVMIYPPDPSRLLGRPLCIADASSQGFSIVFRKIGDGTSKIASLNVGDQLEASGPFGNGYPLADEGVLEKNVVLLGGGLGIPSLLFLAQKLSLRNCRLTVILGYRDRSMNRFLLEDFKGLGVRTIFATDDGSEGIHGTVLDALRNEHIPADIIFACGPMPMLSAIKEYAEKKDIPAFISLEEHMACGVGVCLGCVVKTNDKDEHSNVCNARICTEGPVFEAKRVCI